MNGTKSKPMNRRALIGKLKHFDDGVRSLFEQATDSCQNIYQTYTGDALDLREIQTYPEWKVQMCFRNLRKHHRKRSRQSIIYILPVGPFPKVLQTPIERGSVSTFELIRRFVSCYFFGMTVKFLEEIAVTKVNCKQRFHPVTGKLQLLVTGQSIWGCISHVYKLILSHISVSKRAMIGQFSRLYFALQLRQIQNFFKLKSSPFIHNKKYSFPRLYFI